MNKCDVNYCVRNFLYNHWLGMSHTVCDNNMAKFAKLGVRSFALDYVQ